MSIGTKIIDMVVGKKKKSGMGKFEEQARDSKTKALKKALVNGDGDEERGG